MASTSDLNTTIETVAGGPQEASADGVVVKQHKLPELVAADQYLKQADGAEKKHRGLRFTLLKPPGAV